MGNEPFVCFISRWSKQVEHEVGVRKVWFRSDTRFRNSCSGNNGNERNRKELLQGDVERGDRPKLGGFRQAMCMVPFENLDDDLKTIQGCKRWNTVQGEGIGRGK